MKKIQVQFLYRQCRFDSQKCFVRNIKMSAILLCILLFVLGCGGESSNEKQEQGIANDDFSPVLEVVTAAMSPISGFHGLRATVEGQTSMYALVPTNVEPNDLSINVLNESSNAPDEGFIGGFSYSFSGEGIQSAIAAISVGDANAEVVECNIDTAECTLVPITLSSSEVMSFYVEERHTYTIPVLSSEEVL